MAKTKGGAAWLVAAIGGLLAAGSAAAGSSQGIIQCDGRPAPAGIQDNSRPAPAGIQDNWRPGSKPAPKPSGGDAAIQDDSRSHGVKHPHLQPKPPETAPTGAGAAKGGGG